MDMDAYKQQFTRAVPVNESAAFGSVHNAINALPKACGAQRKALAFGETWCNASQTCFFSDVCTVSKRPV